jgi:hypothetical protein
MGHPEFLVGMRIRTTATADPYGMTARKANTTTTKDKYRDSSLRSE